MKRIKKESKTRSFVVTLLKNEIKKQTNVTLEEEEIQRRLLKYVNNELKKEVASEQVNNMTIVRNEEVPKSGDATILVNTLLMEQAKTRVLVGNDNNSGAKGKAQEIIMLDMQNFIKTLQS